MYPYATYMIKADDSNS